MNSFKGYESFWQQFTEILLLVTDRACSYFAQWKITIRPVCRMTVQSLLKHHDFQAFQVTVLMIKSIQFIKIR